MVQNARVTAFTIFELLKENQQAGGGGGEGVKLHPYTLWKACTNTIKNSKYHLSKLIDHIILAFRKNHERAWTSFQSSQ